MRNRPGEPVRDTTRDLCVYTGSEPQRQGFIEHKISYTLVRHTVSFSHTVYVIAPSGGRSGEEWDPTSVPT